MEIKKVALGGVAWFGLPETEYGTGEGRIPGCVMGSTRLCATVVARTSQDSGFGAGNPNEGGREPLTVDRGTPSALEPRDSHARVPHPSPSQDSCVILALSPQAYYKLALIYHPDKNPDDPDADAKFKAISEAYEVCRGEWRNSPGGSVGDSL